MIYKLTNRLMNLFDKLRGQFFESPQSRLNELVLYEFVAEELSQGIEHKGLFAKALAEKKGDEQEAKGRYIELRVQMLKDQIDLAIADERTGPTELKDEPGNKSTGDKKNKEALKKIISEVQREQKPHVKRRLANNDRLTAIREIPPKYYGETQECIRCKTVFPKRTKYFGRYTVPKGKLEFRTICKWCRRIEILEKKAAKD